MTHYSHLGVPHPFDPTDRYTTSWLLSPRLLSACRLLISLYVFTTIFFIFGWDGSHQLAQSSRRSFSYFTDLTFWGLAFYFLVSGLHTWRYARAGHSWLRVWPRPLQAAHAVFYTTVVTFPFLVTIVYWSILYSGHWFPVVFNSWSNISHHLLNSLFALFEIVLPRTRPPPFLHLLFLIILLALYLALAYVTHATQHFYTYSFLDVSKGSGRVAGYAFGILAGICVVFAAVWALIWFRAWLTETETETEGNGAGGRERQGRRRPRWWGRGGREKMGMGRRGRSGDNGLDIEMNEGGRGGGI